MLIFNFWSSRRKIRCHPSVTCIDCRTDKGLLRTGNDSNTIRSRFGNRPRLVCLASDDLLAAEARLFKRCTPAWAYFRAAVVAFPIDICKRATQALPATSAGAHPSHAVVDIFQIGGVSRYERLHLLDGNAATSSSEQAKPDDSQSAGRRFSLPLPAVGSWHRQSSRLFWSTSGHALKERWYY